jgi:hypothetical protein
MRITRHLAHVAVTTVAVTITGIGITGIVFQSPVSAAPAAEPALVWLEGELNDSGGSLPSSIDPTATDWGLTIDAILALNAGGRGANAPAVTATTALATHIKDYVTGNAFGDPGIYTGPVGKSMLADILQGGDPHSFGGVDLEKLSRAAVQTSGIHEGRFSDQGSNFGDYSNGFGQALNILALSRTPSGVPSGAAAFLLAQQCPGGGFRLVYDTAPVTRGCTTDAEADTDATAFSLEALLALDPGPTTSAAIDRAASHLINQQDPVTGALGGSGPTASVNTNTTGLAAQALAVAGRADAAALARGFVGSLQLDAAHTTGTPAAGEEGAIARNDAAFDEALTGGITDLARDQWRRSTTQAVLAFDLPPFVVPRADAVPVDSARLLDTRPGESTVDGQDSGAGVTAAGSTLVLQVGGRADVPLDAAAAVLNITVDGGQGSGFVTVYPCDAERPLASSLNFVADTPTPNAVITGLAANGTVCLFVAGSGANLIADVSGYFPAASGYHALTPARLLDTRAGESTVDGQQLGAGSSAPGSTIVLPVAGRGGVTEGAAAVVLNVTAVGGEGSGFVTVYPCDSEQPLASNLNFGVDTPIPNAVITKLSANGTVCLYVGANAVDLVADVDGYFPAGSGYNALTPRRFLDTRPGESTIDGRYAGGGSTAAGSTLELVVAGRGGVPADATSVVLNVTAADGAGPGFVTVYNCDIPRPLASNLNFVASTPVPNAVIVKLSSMGTVCMYVGTNPVDLVADVSGYFG